MGKCTFKTIYYKTKFSSKEKKYINILTASRLAGMKVLKVISESIKEFPYGAG